MLCKAKPRRANLNEPSPMHVPGDLATSSVNSRREELLCLTLDDGSVGKKNTDNWLPSKHQSHGISSMGTRFQKRHLVTNFSPPPPATHTSLSCLFLKGATIHGKDGWEVQSSERSLQGQKQKHGVFPPHAARTPAAPAWRASRPASPPLPALL